MDNKMVDNNKDEFNLLVECEDKPGLIHAISGVLFKHGFNIINNREFVDNESGRFFMRTAFTGRVEDTDKLINEVKAGLPDNSIVQLATQRKKNIVVFASLEHHSLAELLIRNDYGELNANIQAVISNHDSLCPLAEKFGIKYFCLPVSDANTELQEKEILSVLDKFKPDYLVLAKYMRILSPEFVNNYKNRIINIHHSFLPAFAGSNPYRQAYDRGVKIIGATAHFVTEELDKGPIIAQDITGINHALEVKDMQQAGRDIEKTTLIKALSLVCEDRVFINGNKTVVFE